MTKLEFTNRILQVLFIRLAKSVDEENNIISWSILYWIVPFTGWESDFKFIGNKSINFYTFWNK